MEKMEPGISLARISSTAQKAELREYPPQNRVQKVELGQKPHPPVCGNDVEEHRRVESVNEEEVLGEGTGKRGSGLACEYGYDGPEDQPDVIVGAYAQKAVTKKFKVARHRPARRASEGQGEHEARDHVEQDHAQPALT
jgi:hypothetical protein